MLLTRISLYINGNRRRSTRFFYWDSFRKDKQRVLEELISYQKIVERYSDEKLGAQSSLPPIVVFMREIIRQLEPMRSDEYLCFLKGEQLHIVSEGANEITSKWEDSEVSIEELLTHEREYLRKLGKKILKQNPP